MDEARWKTLEELIERREESKLDDVIIRMKDVDDSVVQKAKAIETKMKRLRIAKYSQDLFDEIVDEMLKEKRSLMEMMAELDVDENDIYDS